MITFGILTHFFLIYIGIDRTLRHYVVGVVPMFTSLLGLLSQRFAFPLGYPLELLNRAQYGYVSHINLDSSAQLCVVLDSIAS